MMRMRTMTRRRKMMKMKMKYLLLLFLLLLFLFILSLLTCSFRDYLITLLAVLLCFAGGTILFFFFNWSLLDININIQCSQQ